MWRRLPALLLFLVFLPTCGREDARPTCTELCEPAIDCLLADLGGTGDASPALEKRPHLLAACTTACGGRWEVVADEVSCPTEPSCQVLADCLGSLPERLPPPPEAYVTTLRDEQCRAQASGLEACGRLDGADAQLECRRATALAEALRSSRAEGCAALPTPWQGLCEALARRDEARCPTSLPPWHQPCVEFARGRPASPAAHLFAAVAARDPARCDVVEDREDKALCRAVAGQSPDLCPQRLAVDPAWGERLGTGLRRTSRVQEVSFSPTWIAGLHRLLSWLAVLLVPWLLVWLVFAGQALKRTGKRSWWWLAASLVGFLALRLAAVKGPVNFVEYERVFISDPGDIGRLGYAGWSLIAGPFLRLSGGGFALLQGLNLVAGLLAVTALFRIALRLFGKAPQAGLVACLLALQPAFARVAASASETLPFVALSLVFVDVVLHWRRLPLVVVWGAAAIVAPLLLVLRPEGVLFVPLVAACSLLLPEGSLRPLRSLPVDRVLAMGLAAGTGLAAAALFATLPRPPTAAGLWWENLVGFLSDLLNPGFLSPTLLLAGIAGMAWCCVRPRAPESRFVGVAGGLWTVVLLLAWGLQGSEENAALGASRYVVVWLPWLALAAVGAMAHVPVGHVRRGLVALLLAGGLVSVPLLRQESNLQLEYRFFLSALDSLPDGSLLVLPAAPPDNPEFTPEDAPLALLAMARREMRWMTIAETDASWHGEAGSYLLLGIVQPAEQLAAIRARASLEPVVTTTVLSKPDVGPHREVPEGTKVTMGLYRLRNEGQERSNSKASSQR